MFHHRFLHLFHFRPLHYGATKKLGANQKLLGCQSKRGFSERKQQSVSLHVSN